jgi:Sortilin, neurotensin receptor 3,
MWQSSSEGYTWHQLMPGQVFLAFYLHTYASSRGYLVTNTKTFWYTTDYGQQWKSGEAPTVPNTFGEQVLQFHPNSDYLIWTGNEGCDGSGENCRAQAHYSRDNGQSWKLIEDYIQKCAWAKDAELTVDPTQILCESYLSKTGSQRTFNTANNELQLISGNQYFSKKTKVFNRVAGFTKFSEYLIVAEVGLFTILGYRLLIICDH